MSGEALTMGPEAEYWLPSDILDDDDFFLDRHETKKSGSGSPGLGEFPTEFLYDYNSSGFSSSSSNPSSPVDSATESEGQSDDDLDEYLDGLTTQMAHSFLLEKADSAAAPAAVKEHKLLSCSPPPLACASKTLFQVSSPPSPPEAAAAAKDDNPWDALHAAADQVVRMMHRQHMGGAFGVVGGLSTPGGLPQAGKEQHGCFTNNDASAGMGNCYYYHHLKPPTQRQMHFARLQHLKHQRQHFVNQSLAAAAALRQRNGGRSLGVPSPPWPLLPHPAPGTGMRALFLPSAGGLGPKQSPGTGVFLPRRAGSPTQTRRKPACSTVLMPARVVHALNNLNLDSAAEKGPAAGGCFGAVAPPGRRPAAEIPRGGGGGACFAVNRGDDDARLPAAASYSSSMAAGLGDASNNNNNKKNKGCGGEQLRLRHGRLPQQQEHKQQSTTSPETQLPPEWIY